MACLGRALACLLFVLLAACAPGIVQSPVPTQTLIPPAPTITSLPPTPDVAGDDSVENVADNPAILIPAGAHALVQQASADLAAHVSVNPSAIRLLELEAVNWTGDDLGCLVEISQTPGDGASVRGYRLVLEVEGARYEYHTDAAQRVVRCDEKGARGTTADSPLSGDDPIAVELTAMARRRLAETLDLPLQRIRVVSVEPMTWSDTSLGCPQPDVEYAPMSIDGYLLVLEAGETQYRFHSDFDRLIPCSTEVLPATEAVRG